MRRRIQILYEDQRTRGGRATQYGPHELVVSCVADELQVARTEVADRFIAIPKNGDSKLYAACRADIGRLGSQGQPVVAMFDDDKVRRLLGLPAGARKREVAGHITAASDSPRQLCVWLLVSNIETLVEAAAQCLGVSAPSKSPEERDRLLLGLAWREAQRRAELRQRVPSFDCFVAGLARLWACP